MEEMQKQLENLQRQLRHSEDRLKEIEERDNTDEEEHKVLYHYRSERSIKTFKQTDDIEDWSGRIENYIDRFKHEKDKVECILGHLDHHPLTEVKFRIDRRKDTANDVLMILKDVYGNKETESDLEKLFWSRDQLTDESVDDFSLALMEIRLKMKKSEKIKKDKSELMLKCRLADGVIDISLKHELLRLSR